MLMNDEQYERIQQFLDASMTLDEMDTFEKELAANPEMRKQLDFEQAVRDGFSFKKLLEDKVQQVTPIEQKTSKFHVNSLYKINWIAVAAAACILGLVLTNLISNNSNLDKSYTIVKNDTEHLQQNDTISSLAQIKPQDSVSTLKQIALLFKEYFTMDTLPENYPIYLAESFSAYNAGDYSYLEKLNLENVPDMRGNDEVNNKQNILQLGHYYKGIALLKKHNTKPAIVNLEWVEQNGNDKNIKLKAQWYKALAYLINDKDENKTIKLLKEIEVNNIKRYNFKIKDLLKALQQ
jgi:hypothetical protein